jgi:hypothetical protein
MHRALAFAGLLAALPAAAENGPEAFTRGCGGGCHRSAERVIRAIPPGSDAERARWIAAFMERHPCHDDALKAEIQALLVAQSRR